MEAALACAAPVPTAQPRCAEHSQLLEPKHQERGTELAKDTPTKHPSPWLPSPPQSLSTVAQLLRAMATPSADGGEKWPHGQGESTKPQHQHSQSLRASCGFPHLNLPNRPVPAPCLAPRPSSSPVCFPGMVLAAPRYLPSQAGAICPAFSLALQPVSHGKMPPHHLFLMGSSSHHGRGQQHFEDPDSQTESRTLSREVPLKIVWFFLASFPSKLLLTSLCKIPVPWTPDPAHPAGDTHSPAGQAPACRRCPA